MMQQKEGNNKGQSIVFEVLSVIFPKFRTTFGAGDKKDYSVVRAKLYQSSVTLPDGKQLHHGDTIDVTGYGLPRKKSRIRVIGTPVKNKYNQWQFKADLVRLDVDLEEIIDVKRFLVENVRGVSEKTALAILSEFGDKTMDVLRNSPNELYRIKGMSGKRIEVIKDAIANATASEGCAPLLLKIGIPMYAITKINSAFGVDNAKDILLTKPYKTYEIPGISFEMAHAIAVGLNVPNQKEPMYAYGIEFLLKKMETNGSSYYPLQRLVRSIMSILHTPENPFDMEQFKKSLRIVEQKGIVRINWEKGLVGLNTLIEKERFIYETYMSMLPYRTQSNYSELVNIVSRGNRINLHYKQAEAIEILLNHKYGILTGGPGTGKTTVLKCFIECFGRKNGGAKVLCLAPTGRAASRMSESTGRPAFTVHKKLGLKPDDIDLPEGTELKFDLVVVDESSMLDINIAYSLLKALNPQTKLVLVGDEEQLPSVGAGSVLADLIYSGFVGVARLTKTFRQGADSSIIANANLIKDGQSNLITMAEDFSQIPTTYDKAGLNKIVDTYVDACQIYGSNNVVALLPKRAKKQNADDFIICVETVNPVVQERINPAREGEYSRSNQVYTFRKGDRVMQMSNTDTVANGDVGIIVEMNKEPRTNLIYAKVDFGYEGAEAVYYATDEDFSNLTLAYATTIHKSQGSEYACVLTPLYECDGIMLQRNLLYTAVTRAKKKMILLGERTAVDIAVSNTDAFKRDTFLEDLFQNARKKGKFKTIAPFRDKQPRGHVA